ncbi:hypothetical protein RRU01S_10_00850 [Agrobacterium rubi TR3 = NBRC 13261]|uniref:Uncharacterized protein n=1 Tax=Agrobacterium rubi TR3 = NBRC 13261 TaxID=1368415 RepID=A0A081CUA0_9HYPH|nr:hypothetical protein [Agrobacterium rubi]GAK70246.1 hypothetical protein RRU01S_10_00850 [Agrobacterium rubi TR3 = NBRC 13261]
MPLVEMALSCIRDIVWRSSVSIADIWMDENALICRDDMAETCSVVSEATSSVDQLATVAVDSFEIWLGVKEGMIDVMCRP